MEFLVTGVLESDTTRPGIASGRLFVEERDIAALYEYLRNGEPYGPGDQRVIPLLIDGEKCRGSDGTPYMHLTVKPDPKYRKKEVQLSAESLADAFNGEIINDRDIGFEVWKGS